MTTGAEALFLEHGSSDHLPIIVSLGVELHTRRTPFKFFNFWADYPQYGDLVSMAWNTPLSRSPMYTVSHKLKLVKASLKRFNLNNLAAFPH